MKRSRGFDEEYEKVENVNVCCTLQAGNCDFSILAIMKCGKCHHWEDLCLFYFVVDEAHAVKCPWLAWVW